MDIRDGKIYEAKVVDLMSPEERKFLRPMVKPPTPDQQASGKVGRNHDCPCGSGHKFKRCCMRRLDADRLERLKAKTQTQSQTSTKPR